ncbi:MAG: SLC13 family permease [Gammaproteobacteria bacterium]|nr:SLC13 family permease [Gammaproteobacteria bacterium]
MVLTLVALLLFSRDRIPLETSCLFILVVLIVVFFVAPYEAANGAIIDVSDFIKFFGNQAVVAIGALMVLGKGLEETGALRPLVLMMSSGWKARPKMTMLLTLTVSAIASAFLNNTPIVVMLLPVLVAAAIRTHQSPSGLLMPMGLATIIGGMSTTIGTSTNLMAVDIASDFGLTINSLFYFTFPVAIASVFGLGFLWLLAPKLLPERVPPMDDTSPRVFNAILRVTEGSYPQGKTLSEVLAKTGNRMQVTRIQRGYGLFGEGLFITKLPSVEMQPGDLLYVNDRPDNLKEFERELGLTLYSVDGEDADLDTPVDDAHPLTAKGQALAEVVVTRGSLLHQRTLNAVKFVARYNLLPLAIHRAKGLDVESDGNMGDVRLRAGDVLLVQGTEEAIRDLRQGGAMLVLDGKVSLPDTKNARRALAISAFVIGTAAFGILPIVVSALIGVCLLVITRTMRWSSLLGAISAPVIMIIVTSLALSLALLRTGGAEYIAQVFVASTQTLPTPFIVSGLMLVTAVLTNVVSNAAAAGIGVPIALSVAQQLGAPPEPFFLAVLFGANMSFATPMGYQTNLLVMAAGGYKFSDFLRVGVPLTLIMWLAFSIILPFMYKL